jgi:hypothetical protein
MSFTPGGEPLFLFIVAAMLAHIAGDAIITWVVSQRHPDAAKAPGSCFLSAEHDYKLLGSNSEDFLRS